MEPTSHRTLKLHDVCLAGLFLISAACSSPSPATSVSGSGGKKANTSSGSGGSSAGGKGGSQNAGGSNAGGSAATGGSAGSGGTGGAGGTSTSGGSSGAGGASSGGSGSGGAAGAGGAQASGGRDAGADASGGSATGGKAAGGSSAGGNATGGTAAGGTAAGGSATGGAATGGTSGTTSDGCTDQLATGITISEIAVFQAGKISVMKNGNSVTPTTSHGGQLIQGKDGMFRVYVTVDNGFQSRSLSARLKLNGGSVSLYSKATIAASSTELSAANSFTIAVPASAFVADMDYQVQLVECGTGSGNSHNPIFPANGTASLATRKTGVVKITMLPVTSGGVTPTLDQAFLDPVTKTMNSMYPTTATQITVSNSPITGCTVTGATAADDVAWSDCLDRLRARRTSDRPASDVYYVAVLKPESTFNAFCGMGCITGISLVPGVNMPSGRVSLVDGYLPDALITIPHEVGHAHGIEHSPGCGAAEPDAAFPYVTNGKGYIGWIGYDKQQSPIKFFDPAKYIDIMAYCSPQWVSDYVYREMADRIATLSGAHMTSTGVPQTWRVALETAGKLRWGVPITTPVPAEGAPAAATVLDAQAAQVAQITVYRTPTSHGGSSYMVPEPETTWARLQIGDASLAF